MKLLIPPLPLSGEERALLAAIDAALTDDPYANPVVAVVRRIVVSSTAQPTVAVLPRTLARRLEARLRWIDREAGRPA